VEAERLFSFALTTAQVRVLAEIEHDLRAGQPMHRLLQGDVGSGKTAVAITAAAAVARAGLQTAIMAPPSSWRSNTGGSSRKSSRALGYASAC